MARSSNGFEYAGRLIKLDKLVAALDDFLPKHEDGPIDPLAPWVPDALAKWTENQWARFAVTYGIRPPSMDKTVPALLARLRDRAAEQGRKAS